MSMIDSDHSEHDNDAKRSDAMEDESETSSAEHSEVDEEDHDEPDSVKHESGGKKKKKKKKKKKAAKEEAQDGKPVSQPPTNVDKATKEAAEKRINAAMESLRSGDDLWVDLSNGNLHDAKAKKVVELLKTNTSVTALNLSGNCISDAGIQALASALQGGGGAELIELDVRGNNLTDAGLSALEALGKARKELKVKMGALVEPEPATTSSSSPFQGGKVSPRKGASGSGAQSGSKSFQEVTQGPMFRKYFQTDEDDDDDGGLGTSGGDDQSTLDFSERSEELWDQLKESLGGGKDSVPALSAALWTICIFLEREVSNVEPPLAATTVEGLKPHIRQAVQNLTVLDSILDIVPEPVTVQFSGETQPAVGSHRLWATEVVALLLHLSTPFIDQLIAATKLVPKALELALCHPLNNALQSRTRRILHSCVHSRHEQLWIPLLHSSDDTQTASLQQRIAQIVTDAKDLLPGKRTANVGFALDVTRLLHDCCSKGEPAFVQSVCDKLQADEAWTSYWESEAAQQLWKEHEGVLGGGERPKKFDSLDDQKEMEARIISGHKLLSILQGMNAVST